MPFSSEEVTLSKRNATAAVIGAGDFIGSEIAKKFSAEGFTVFAGRRNGDKLAPLVKDRAGPGCLDSAPLDLSGFLPGYAERGALRFCRCVGRA
ncbi:NAD(P)-dependent dehydrogenase (short-subunit alcohol dehydrogenase family) [Bradyrhizobium japonicum]